MSNQESWAKRLLAWLHGKWIWLRERLLTLKPCRFALLMVLTGLVFLIFASHGQDVVRALAERPTGGRDDWQRFCFFAAALLWSLSAWYWARVMLFLRFPDVPAGADRSAQGIRTWTPRLIGFFATLGIAYAMYKASLGYAANEHADTQERLRDYAYWCAIGAVAFLVAVSARRTLSRAAYKKLKDAPALQGRLAAPLVNALNMPRSKEEAYGALENFKDLSPVTRLLLIGALAVAVTLFLVFTASLQSTAPVIGTAAILLLAAAGWIAVGSVLDFFGMRLRFPVFTTLLLLAMVFSLWNDNHTVRTMREPQLVPGKRDDLQAALQSWMARQQNRLAAGDKDKIPLFLVNAEGGGIRAAYWTATVLGEIQDRDPCFAEQLFSLSGVSGSSLGASVFVALLVEQRVLGGAPRCGQGAPSATVFKIKDKAQAILSEDFLAPVVASILYPDLVQRFLPWPVARFDRAIALERAWERAWRNHMRPTNRFAQPFDWLWHDRSAWTPALFLNATWVEAGKRVIVSNVHIRPRDPGAFEDFVDAEDAQRFLAPRSLRLSTAVHLSARFSYVSPAGTLVKDGRPYGRVVDGGYFENSGATTTLEILQTIGLMAAKDKRWERVEPYVIHISNDPVDPSAWIETAADHPTLAPRQWLNDARSPIATLINTRGARGAHARETLHWQAGSSHFLHFGLCRGSSNIPLGWVLSKSTRDRMEKQLLTDQCPAQPTPAQPQPKPIFDNPGNLKEIGSRLALPVKTAPAKRR